MSESATKLFDCRFPSFQGDDGRICYPSILTLINSIRHDLIINQVIRRPFLDLLLLLHTDSIDDLLYAPSRRPTDADVRCFLLEHWPPLAVAQPYPASPDPGPGPGLGPGEDHRFLYVYVWGTTTPDPAAKPDATYIAASLPNAIADREKASTKSREVPSGPLVKVKTKTKMVTSRSSQRAWNRPEQQNQKGRVSLDHLKLLFVAVVLHGLAHRLAAWWGTRAGTGAPLRASDWDPGEFVQRAVFGGVLEGWWALPDAQYVGLSFEKMCKVAVVVVGPRREGGAAAAAAGYDTEECRIVGQPRV